MARTPKGLLSRVACAMLACLALALAACSGQTSMVTSSTSESDYLTFVDTEPKSVDPHCIVENYTVALNIFDRLVETEKQGDDAVLVPSLADSWEQSDDGLTYRFALHPNVVFSNGAKLTASDVKYSFERMLTNSNSRHADLVSDILGAEELVSGQADELAGFKIVDDYQFVITLARPAAAFLAGLSTPGASILDEDTTVLAGASFGKDLVHTVGTGPFVLASWSPGKSIILSANPTHWAGTPTCAGLKLEFFGASNSLHDLYEDGELDILDLDKLGMEAEYFMRGDAYLKNLVRGQRVGLTYIALNNAVEPLSDVRVRKALALGLNRSNLLTGAVGGRGTIENGILPRGLLGHNNDLAEIPYDPEQARQLLAEAGFADGFDLTISCPGNASQSVRDLLTLTASMWSEIGVRARIETLDSATYTARCSDGNLACYASTFSAKYNDPQNFMDTFFGGREATTSCSVCYQNDAVMQQVRDARYIVNQDERLRTYQDLEKTLVQEDYALIPLFSKMHLFLVNSRVKGFEVRWNGWSSNRYDKVSVMGGSS